MPYSHEETLESNALKGLQSKRLKETLQRVKKTPFYKDKIDINQIKSIDDISKLPFTTKKDLRDNYPFGLLCVPMDEIVRIHSSSGTTGKPTVVAYNEHDMNVWAEVIARAYTMAGLTSKDILHNATGYGLFTGGLGFHDGAELLKIAVVPSSTGFTSRQLMILKDFQATAMTGTPSFALHLAEKAKVEGYDIKNDFALKVGFFGAEPASDGLKDEIARIWGIDYHEIYGLSEIVGPGVASSCKCSKLLHINEDHFYPEIINPQTGEVLNDGEAGELVVTTLTKEALPVLRYRTGDITTLTHKKCECGRTTARMKSVFGRSDDMLVVNGVNVFPSQIEHVLSQNKHITLNYQIIAKKKGYLDKLELDVEMNQTLMSDDISKLEKIKKELQAELLNALYINVDIKLVKPNTIERSEGKAKRIKDERMS